MRVCKSQCPGQIRGLSIATTGHKTPHAAYGLTNILKPVVTAETLGHTGFGSISGLLAMPYLACFAIAPFAGAWLWQIGGYDLAISAAALMAFLGLVAITLLASLDRRGALAQRDQG